MAKKSKKVTKQDMLRCQWYRRHSYVILSSVVRERTLPKRVFLCHNCKVCPHRFICLTMKASRFEGYVEATKHEIHEIFAETGVEAEQIFYKDFDVSKPMLESNTVERTKVVEKEALTIAIEDVFNTNIFDEEFEFE